MNIKNKSIFRGLLWFLEGVIVGFGAIMPGISGGTLCVAFGMYQPLIEIFSHPRTCIRKYGKMLAIFVLGGAFGFIGLSGFAGWLMGINSNLVVCAFVGFIIGTFPELWRDAGSQGRPARSYVAVIVGFFVMLGILFLLKTKTTMVIQADVIGFLFCGLLWGLSFIVPGLSSSTLLIFFGLYQPMLDGIAHIDLRVVIPIALGAGACILLLSKGVDAAYKKQFTLISHGIIGIVAATTVMIFPGWKTTGLELVGFLICIVCGALVSYLFTYLCSKLKK